MKQIAELTSGEILNELLDVNAPRRRRSIKENAHREALLGVYLQRHGQEKLNGLIGVLGRNNVGR